VADLVTAQSFRSNFPDFASSATYPNGQVQFYLDLAYSMLNADRWRAQLPFGVQLWAAHNLILAGNSQSGAAGSGSAGGGAAGPIASQSVDKVSVSFDTGKGTLDGAGAWNLTNYGTRFYQLMRIIGAGGMQVNIGPHHSHYWTGDGCRDPLNTVAVFGLDYQSPRLQGLDSGFFIS
jgi:hypothetical protein